MKRQPPSVFAATGAGATGLSVGQDGTDGPGVQRLAFGRSYNFGDWAITVSEPVRFTPSDGALDADKHELATKVKYTVSNNSGSRQVSTSGIYVQVQVDGHKAMRIYDHRQQLGCLPLSNVPPGHAVSWYEGYGYDATGQHLTILVSDLLDFDGPLVEYDGTL